MPCATLSLAECAEMVGVSTRLLYKLIERGEGPPLIRLGRRIIIRRESAEQWLSAREDRPAPLNP